jgi:uncharacterized protein
VGAIKYVQIPATDIDASAEFYASVFGWRIRTRADGERAFDDGGVVSGAWVLDRPPSREPGLLVWVEVDSVEAALQRVTDAGGEVVSPLEPQQAGEAIATFRDPAGNVLGVFHQGRGE